MINKSQKESDFIHLEMNMQREPLFAQKYFLAWGAMGLRLMNQATQPITAEILHDSLQLSKLSGTLTS